jgi:phosphoribosylglycinamide formyltransferase 2
LAVVLCRSPTRCRFGLKVWHGGFAMSETNEPKVPSRPTVMLLGVGDTGGELASAFTRLGTVVVTVEECADAEELTGLIDEHAPRYVVATSGDVSADVLIAAAENEGVEVFPSPRATRLGLDREGLRRLAADELGLPTVPFWFAGSADELAAIAEHAGFPLSVTPAVGAQSDGSSVVLRPDDIDPAWQVAIRPATGGHRASSPADPPVPNRVMAETIVEVDDEVTLLTVRTIGQSGPAVHFCEPIGHRAHPDGALEAWQPHAMSLAALDAARSIAARIVNSLGGRGVFGVELLLRSDEVYFATVLARPTDYGLVTLRSQRLSQFELHARAILGLPLDTISISPAAAEVGTADTLSAVPAQALAEALAIPESDVRLVGGASVALATAPDVVRARDRAHRVVAALGGAGS